MATPRPAAERSRNLSGQYRLSTFRALGPWRQSLDTVLSQQRADRDEPVVMLLHLACPRVEYTDRGKSAVVVSR